MPTEQTDVSKKPLVFVSHSSKDKLIADAICARLENQGIRCWIAPRDVDPGRDYSDQIAEALENSSVMVMVVSSGANSSRHVKSEIDRAFSLGQIIIPFRVENIELDKGLSYYLSKTHWLDAVNPPLEHHIDRLAATILKLFNQERPPAAPAPPLPVQPVTQPAVNKWLWPLLAAIAALVAVVGVLGFLFLSSRHENARSEPPPASASPAKNLPPSPITPSPSAASVADQTSIEGIWTISGAQTLEGASYGGTVEFIKHRDRYQVMWQTSAGAYSGVGLMRGNKLCVGWSPEMFGVVFYKINGDGTLDGTWTVVGAAANQTDGVEKATGGIPGRVEGRYLVTGSNPGSQAPYGGQLEITRTGATYQLKWKVGNSSNTGVGIKVDDDLFAAWADKKHAFGVVSYTFDGRRAKGIWTLGGSSRTATEDLLKP
jgi:hypothetical protein